MGWVACNMSCFQPDAWCQQTKLKRQGYGQVTVILATIIPIGVRYMKFMSSVLLLVRSKLCTANKDSVLLPKSVSTYIVTKGWKQSRAHRFSQAGHETIHCYIMFHYCMLVTSSQFSYLWVKVNSASFYFLGQYCKKIKGSIGKRLAKG